MQLKVTEEVIEQLEFDKIVDLVCSYCKGVASNSFREKPFLANKQLQEDSHHQVLDWLRMKRMGEDLVLGSYESVEKDLDMLSKEGYVLDAEAVLRMIAVLENYHSFYTHFNKDKRKEYNFLFHAGHIDDYSQVPINVIRKVFNEKGEVMPNASPALTKIFKKIEQAGRDADIVFDGIVRKFKSQNLLADHPESWKNGRRVLVIPAENKRKIPGVIHDQSTSGKTVFVEPQEIIQINNHVFSLENEKRAEVHRILRQVSIDLRLFLPLITRIYHQLIQIDLLSAKAVLAYQMDAEKPEMSSSPILGLKKVRHPLLVIQEGSGGPPTVPFDLDLRGRNRMLLISGPNAGGKSVTLKAVGLVHLMAYAGFLVPISSESTIGGFSSIFSDIGDQQSIDQGLSTYSSHLKNLDQIVKNADHQSLILLDEIGSGTDPKLGGAIAEGVLKVLLAKKVYGVVTTHYSALKVFAFRQKNILNGAMLFDKENLRPSYQLKVGKPGSSFAFEVAKKIGLSEEIIAYARKKVGSKENAVEDLLVNLQQGKARLDEQLAVVEGEKERLTRLIINYDQMAKDYQVKRKRLQIRSKELEAKKIADQSAELQILINELQKDKNLEKAKELKKEAQKKSRKEVGEIKELKKEVLRSGKSDFVVKKGSYVRLVDSEMSGEVIKLKKEKAEVLFGLLKMDVPISDLIEANDPLEINRNKRINVKGVAFNPNFSPKLDIRGYKMEDAERTLDEFFDKALVNNVSTLEIVHGKGSGALRKLVKKKLKDYSDITRSWHPEDELGGDGVTLIKM